MFIGAIIRTHQEIESFPYVEFLQEVKSYSFGLYKPARKCYNCPQKSNNKISLVLASVA